MEGEGGFGGCHRTGGDGRQGGSNDVRHAAVHVCVAVCQTDLLSAVKALNEEGFLGVAGGCAAGGAFSARDGSAGGSAMCCEDLKRGEEVMGWRRLQFGMVGGEKKQWG